MFYMPLYLFVGALLYMFPKLGWGLAAVYLGLVWLSNR